MAEVIREEHVHHDDHGGNSGMGMIVAAIVLVVVVILLLWYGIPYIRGLGSSPAQINVPGQIDVNVNEK